MMTQSEIDLMVEVIKDIEAKKVNTTEEAIGVIPVPTFKERTKDKKAQNNYRLRRQMINKAEQIQLAQDNLKNKIFDMERVIKPLGYDLTYLSRKTKRELAKKNNVDWLVYQLGFNEIQRRVKFFLDPVTGKTPAQLDAENSAELDALAQRDEMLKETL